MKKTLIIDGHPYEKSFCHSIATTYFENLIPENQKQSTLLHLKDLHFELNLKGGYREKLELEPDLVRAQNLIKEANHIVVITPVWWGGPTALLKGFLDRIMLPGFAFKYKENSVWWDKLLTGKSAHIFITSDAPAWYMRFLRGDATVKILRESTLYFVGISDVKVTRFGNIKGSSNNDLKHMLGKVAKYARSLSS